MMRRWKLLIIQYILMILLLPGCSGNEPQDATTTALPSPSPMHTLTPIPTPTSSPTSTATPTPTITPVPTYTPLPSPTTIPEGYYENEIGGYSLVFPLNWEIVEESNGNIMMMDSDEMLFFSGISEIMDDDSNYDRVLFDFVNGLGLGTEILTQDIITLRDGSEAHRAILDGNLRGYDSTIHLVWAERNLREYLFLVWGPDEEFVRYSTEIKNLFESIEIGIHRVYGQDNDKTLVLVGYDPYPGDLDPARTTGSAEEYVGLLYSGLVRLSPEMQVEADLAEAWEISGDGTVYTFTLRSGLVFESGKPIHAEDIKYSWERAADPGTTSQTAKTCLGDIVGVRDKLVGKVKELAGVQVIDERTLVVQLDGPKPYFLTKLTYPTSFVVDQESVEADPEGWMFNPNASGPFVLAEFREEEALIFKSNQMYHTPPQLEGVVYLLYLAGNRLSHYQSGTIDITGLSETDIVVVKETDHPNFVHLQSVPSMCTTFISVNNTRPPMDDPMVRRAFAHAVDKEQLNELFNENLDRIANSILPPAMPGFQMDLAEFVYDPDVARAALSESGYADGLPTIRISDSGYGEFDNPIVLALMDMWKETLGARFETEVVDPENFVTLLREADEHLHVWGWCADYPDPENFLDIIFHSESDFNLVNYENRALDVLLERGRTELDPKDRIAIYNRAENLIVEDCAAIPLWHSVFYILVNPRVEGYILSPMGVPIIHRLRLVQEMQ